MKKYLIAAAWAVAISGVFVGCKDDQIANSTVEQKIQAFEDIFVQAFGQPDPNHTWGFGSPVGDEQGVTRSVDVNGNLWAERPEVTAVEAQAVYNYVNRPKSQIPRNTYYEVSPVNFRNFFVTQVWGGQSSDENCNYTDLDNNAVFGPEKMNHLQISKSATRLGNAGAATTNGTNDNPGGEAINSDWDHANNFNAAQNRDWDGNTMFVNWGTQNFAYHNSYDNKYHDKWIIVDGAYVYDTNGKNYPGKYYVCFDFIATNDQTKTVFKVEWITNTPNPNEKHSKDFEYTGVYTIGTATEAELTVTIDGEDIKVGTEGYTWSVTSYVQGNKVVLPNEYYTDWIIRLTEAQLKEGVMPDVKVIGSGTEVTGKVKREIITAETVVQAGRVFCEDIVSARYALEDLDYNDVVFDAAIVHKYRKLVSTYYDNDDNLIVFENGDPNPKVEYDFTGIEGQADGYSNYYAKVCVLAAGGTLPIDMTIVNHNTKDAIYNDEIHNILDGKSTNVMINTLLESERARVNMAEVALTKPAKMLKRRTKSGQTLSDEELQQFPGVRSIDEDIILDVKYGNVAAGIKSKYYNGVSGEAVASAKFLVPLGTPWAKERVNIAKAYSETKFKNWIKNELETENDWWNYPTSQDSLFVNAGLQGLDPDVWSKGNFLSVADSVTTLEDVPMTSTVDSQLQTVAATNTMLASPGSGETILFDFTAEGSAPGYLYNDANSYIDIRKTTTGYNSIVKGSKIRVYGVSIDGWEVNIRPDISGQTGGYNASNSSDYATKGYIDIPVTTDTDLSVNDFIRIYGKNFTVTYVTVVNSGSGPGEDTGGAFWTGSQEGDFVISGADLTKNGLIVNSIVRYTGTRGQYYCNYGFHEGKNNSGLDGVEVSAKWVTADMQVTSDGYVDVKFTTQAAVDHVRQYGYKIAFGNFTCKKVEFINP